MKNEYIIVSIATMLVILTSITTVNASIPSTLIYRSDSQSIFDINTDLSTTPLNPSISNGGQMLPSQVSIFYPTKGQSTNGSCWMGLRTDSNDNVYPINAAGFYKILPNGTLVNGVDDTNLFASGSYSDWGELNESSGMLYTAFSNDVRSAPFLEGSTFSPLISGLSGGEAIVLGESTLTGSLFITDNIANQISRVRLSPLQLSTFASGDLFFNYPEAVASAPDGTLYVVNIGNNSPKLTKISTDGTPSVFLNGTISQVNRAIAVDNAGNIYWSDASGINKYDSNGNFLGMLSGPPDKLAFGNPMGAAFDSNDNLYIVDNFDCKKIYKYSLIPAASSTVSISTDKASYSPGDNMIVTLNISNPTSNPVKFEWYIGIPQSNKWITYVKTSIPSGYNNTYTVPIPVGNWSPSPMGLVHYVHLLDSTTREVLAQDAAVFAYSPTVMNAPQVDIAEELMRQRVKLSN